MFAPDQYELLDFGDGRRLERFGPWLLDRPCPAADGVARAQPDAWPQADARFDRTEGEEGRWSLARESPAQWMIAHGPVCFELKRAPAGQLGVFPEQAANWDWIAQQLEQPRAEARGPASPLRVLNLFAYTGGSTLVAAAVGAEVVHVDAARNTVVWARRNAELSGLAERPIRWIAEDATKFVKRELRRGNQYDAVILDPPSYGHGPRGEVWRLSKHLPRLMQLCGQLTGGRRRFMLLTCHTPGFDPARLEAIMTEALGETDQGTVTARQLTIRSAAGRELPSGVVACWQASV
jgi:23S rRNA (cytosine1962-C5)-methyltransferase